MKAAFSEFSYGFALSYEIITLLQPTMVAAPIFPSLTNEARVGVNAEIKLPKSADREFPRPSVRFGSQASFWGSANS
jgi:hypothetical protein